MAQDATATATETYPDLRQTIEKAVSEEEQNLKRLHTQLEQLQSEAQAWKQALVAYKIQMTTYTNLLLTDNTPIKELDKAWNETRISAADLEKRLTALRDANTAEVKEQKNTEQQISTYQLQLDEMWKALPKDTESLTVIQKTQALLSILSEKSEVLIKFNGLRQEQIKELSEISKAFSKLSNQFNEHFTARKQTDIFQRDQSPLQLKNLKSLNAEADRLLKAVQESLSWEFIRSEAVELWDATGFSLISLGLLLAVMLFLLMRLHVYLHQLQARPFWIDNPAHHLALRLVNRSIFLSGITFYLYFLTYINNLIFSTPSIQLVVNLLLIWLLTGWAKDSLKFLTKTKSWLSPPTLAGPLKFLIKFIRYFAILYALTAWVLDPSSLTLLLGRLFFEICLFVWCGIFWRAYRFATDEEKTHLKRAIKSAVLLLVHVIALTGLVMELIGYGALSLYWFQAWGWTAIALLWWGLFLLITIEWDQVREREPGKRKEEYEAVVFPMHWLMVRLSQFVWIVTLVFAVILAWGGRQAVIMKILQALAHPFDIGSMKLSVLGLIYAVLTLLATHALTRMWRYVFHRKFLAPSGMEIGLQDSITTLTVYIIWVLGILFALHAFGLNVATLAIAFGALGIGLGFGLQNIFNNFLSGIILLIERPIQVGDDIEINGKWAVVKKINVRATIVQTYDNASLIIPNSEFISQQLTNWSFKDKSLRRNIMVGVAYGSDTGLVRRTLLEIAEQNPKVRRHPKPDVLFTDFGDSSLNFNLRIWTHVDYMLAVETEIRFEIDRLFRERNIEISFPQRDIHIRSDFRVPQIKE